jgi:hypothetical protein
MSAHPTRRTFLSAAVIASVAGLTRPSIARATPSTTAATADPVPLGTPLMETNVSGSAVVMTPDGEPRMYAVIAGTPAVLAVVDPRTAKTLWTSPLTGGGTGALVVLDNGDVYIGGAGNVYRLRWGSQTPENLGKPVANQTVTYSLTVGDDGLIYGVTYPGAALFSIDPSNDAVRNFGSLVDDAKHAYAVTALDGNLYVGTGSSPHFLRVDPATGAVSEIAMPDGSARDNPLASVFDVDAVGDIVYVRIGDDIKYSPLYPYHPDTDSWDDPIDDVAGLGLPPAGPDGEVYVMTENALTAYDPATKELNPTPLTYPGRVYNYRGTGWIDLGDSNWPGQTLVGFFWRGEVWRYNPTTARTQTDQSDVPRSPVDIISLSAARGGGVWVGGHLVGFAHVAEDGDSSYHRWSQTESFYDDGRNLWLGAYPDSRGYRFDPGLPFNDPDYFAGPPGSAINPVKLWDFATDDSYTGPPQDRIFAITRTGRWVLVATGPKLTAFGGTLVVYDTKTGRYRIIGDLARERALTSLAVRHGNVYAGSWINGGTGSSNPPQSEGTVLAYDLEHSRVRWQVSPEAGATSYVATQFDARGRLWTLAGTALLQLNPATGAVKRRVQLRGTVSTISATFPSTVGTVAQVPGKDALYVSVAGRLSRVWGATGRVDDLGEFGYRQFSVLRDGQLVLVSGATLYRWRPPTA